MGYYYYIVLKILSKVTDTYQAKQDKMGWKLRKQGLIQKADSYDSERLRGGGIVAEWYDGMLADWHNG